MMQRAAENKGTVFRYCPEFRHKLENNGTDFLYLDFSR
jgi:hypothetical protein